MDKDYSLKWYRSLRPQEFNELSTISSSLINGRRFSILSISISESTYGYYWCAIDGCSPTGVTPICPQYINTTAPACNNTALSTDVNKNAVQMPAINESFLANISECLPPPPPSPTDMTISLLHEVYTSSILMPSSLSATSSSQITRAPYTNGIIETPSSSPVMVSMVQSSTTANTTTQPVNMLLVALIVVCMLLGCVALMIALAIIMLCYLTKRGNSKDYEQGESVHGMRVVAGLPGCS